MFWNHLVLGGDSMLDTIQRSHSLCVPNTMPGQKPEVWLNFAFLFYNKWMNLVDWDRDKVVGKAPEQVNNREE